MEKPVAVHISQIHVHMLFTPSKGHVTAAATPIIYLCPVVLSLEHPVPANAFLRVCLTLERNHIMIMTNDNDNRKTEHQSICAIYRSCLVLL